MEPLSTSAEEHRQRRICQERLATLEPHVVRLTNGRFTTLLSTVGGGYSTWDDRALTRWTDDSTRDADGYFVYVRDLDQGRFWSASLQPVPGGADEYACQIGAGRVEITRCETGIHTSMTVCVAPQADLELRRIRVTNRTADVRRLEFTSYAELVLHDAAADAAHPAFSKLFVATGCDSTRSAIWAVRRPRQSDEPTLCATHFVAGKTDHASWSPELQYETDRARFVGRGRTTVDPYALVSAEPMSSTTGSVLDPIFSLRRFVSLGPGESTDIVFALAAAQERQELDAIVDAWANVAMVEDVFTKVAGAATSTQHDADQDAPPAAAAGSAAHDRNERESPGSSGSAPAVRGAAAPASPRYRRAARAHSVDNDAIPAVDGPSPGDQVLEFHNGYGGFSVDGREYVLRLVSDGRSITNLPPMPWANVVANEQAGFIATESGAGYTWVGNSRENRLTPWFNDPISDPHGEALFIRDEDRLCYWSPTPGPAPHEGSYEVRHGFGYTRFLHRSEDLWQEVVQFVPRAAPLKVTHLRVRNESDRPRRLSIFSYQQWVLGSSTVAARGDVETAYDESAQAIVATNKNRSNYAEHVAFAAVTPCAAHHPIHYSADRAAFLGRYGSLRCPQAVAAHEALDGCAGAALDPCAALQATIELAPGEARDCVFLLGEAPSRQAAREAVNEFGHIDNVTQALGDVQAFWLDMLSTVQVETPSPALNFMANGWLPYQNLSCRMWGRSSYYQSGGAFGFRDQLQDAAALIYHRPQWTRHQILLNAAHQFVEGDVLHWWHPPQSLGVRTRFSDDRLWLPLITCEYVNTTGDSRLWDESVRFLQASSLADGEPEALLQPEEAAADGTLYEHCCRAIDISLTEGAHGLPLMGCGDWNDGMSRIGIAGRGESVWLGFFLHMILKRMVVVCQRRGDTPRAERYGAFAQKLASALNDSGWDGEWYRRAYFDDGTPVGSARNEECQIDALVQAWSVMSRVAPPERAAQAVAAVEERLVCEPGGLIRLLTPPFDRMAHDPGYIKGYLPGIRENGGQYTHGVLWFIRALAEMGRGTRAVELLEMLLPIHHTRTPEQVAVYQTEPYVVAADVYGESPHLGRGGWTWYTGSAGWMWRVAFESILGVRVERGRTLIVDPGIAASWSSCRVRYRLSGDGTVYEIEIRNPRGKEAGVSKASLDGQPVLVENGAARVPLARDAARHQVDVEL